MTLDTNVVIRIILDDQPTQHQLARELLNSLTAENPAYLSREVVQECVWVMETVKKMTRKQIASVLWYLLGISKLRLETPKSLAKCVDRYEHGNHDFSDLMIQEYAERQGAYPVVTFDRKFSHLPGVKLLTTH